MKLEFQNMIWADRNLEHKMLNTVLMPLQLALEYKRAKFYGLL